MRTGGMQVCNRYTEPVPVAARGGELGAPRGCADHRTCSHVLNCRYEDEGVSMGRARERAYERGVCLLKGIAEGTYKNQARGSC